jgi:hypothetical protein
MKTGHVFDLHMERRSGKTHLLVQIAIVMRALGYNVTYMCATDPSKTAFKHIGLHPFDHTAVDSFTAKTVVLEDDCELMKYTPQHAVVRAGGICVSTTSPWYGAWPSTDPDTTRMVLDLGWKTQSE